jgi:hypothetical protein
MKKLFLVSFAFAFITAQAQTADEVIQKYSSAMGGLENFNKVKSAKFSGTITAQGNDQPVTVQIINGKAMRTDAEIMGQTITNSYEDGKGWKINPYAGASTATDVSGAELNEFKAQSFLASQLMDYKARNYKVESLGQEDVDGTKANKIKLTTEDNKEIIYYLDANTNLLLKSVGKRETMGQVLEVETYYNDIKEFGGIKFSTSRTVKVRDNVVQEVHFDKIELNVPIDEKIFEKK